MHAPSRGGGESLLLILKRRAGGLAGAGTEGSSELAALGEDMGRQGWILHAQVTRLHTM